MPPSRSRRPYKRKPKEPSTVGVLANDTDLASTPSLQQANGKKVRWGEAERAGGTSNVSSRDNSDTEESSIPEKVCLAAFCQYGRIGCAYYDPVKCIVYALEDTQESSHYDLTKMILEQASADVILTSSRSDDEFIDTLQEHADESSNTFQIRPHKDFTHQKGRERVLSLGLLSQLPQEDLETSSQCEDGSNTRPGNAYDFMKRRGVDPDPARSRWNASIRLSNFISAETSPLCMASIGALIDYLVRERLARDLDDNVLEALDVRDIELLTLSEEMQINADALFSLQVFESESHASIHSDKSKEGLSLFDELRAARDIEHYPDGPWTLSFENMVTTAFTLYPRLYFNQVITARHDAVECFVRAENLVTSGVMRKHLKGIKNMPRVIGVLKADKAKLQDWQCLVKFAFHGTMLKEAVTELSSSHNITIVQKLHENLDVASFKEVGSAVNEIIDWEESATSGRVCVRPHVDEELDKRKHVYYGIDAVLSRAAEEICKTVPARYASLNVVYFPQLGYLICVPMLEELQGDLGIDVVDGWTFQFSSQEYVYFKSQEMRDMDTHIGDLHSAIVDREIEIIQELLDRVLVYSQMMIVACDVCAELDCLLAFAAASNAYDYKRPTMVEDDIISIRQGRHPLHEHIVDTFVPNDAHIVGGRGLETEDDVTSSEDDETPANSIVICTGANGCGKSVYLKQVALVQYMAQIGCFVPAEEATLGVVDKIFTRVSTRESVSKAQSSFMIDLNQVSLALRNSTLRSLILLDEFGKGTLSSGSDGAGLFCGVIQHLLSRGKNCPKVLAATHFHDVFHQDILDASSLPITFVHMQIMFMVCDGANDVSEVSDGQHVLRPSQRMTYLYRVVPGLSLESHAAKCAEICGLPLRYVQRAQYVSELLAKHEIVQLLDEDMTEEERRALENAEAICRRFLAWDLDAEVEEPGDIHGKLAEVLGRGDDDCDTL